MRGVQRTTTSFHGLHIRAMTLQALQIVTQSIKCNPWRMLDHTRIGVNNRIDGLRYKRRLRQFKLTEVACGTHDCLCKREVPVTLHKNEICTTFT